MFLGDSEGNVNIKFCLHVANFFKYHTRQRDEGSLNEIFFNELTFRNRPDVWDKALKHGLQKLGATWMGSYSMLIPVNSNCSIY